MGKILDLSMFVEETLDIKTANGLLLHIPKPTQRQIIEIQRFKNITEESTPEEIMAALNRIVSEALNSNREGIKFDADAIEALPLDARLAILREYTAFATRLASNPTWLPPACLGRSAKTPTQS